MKSIACLLFAFLTLCFSQTPLPISAPLVSGYDKLGVPYVLYTSALQLNIADPGLWLTPINATNLGNGTYLFQTISPILYRHEQLSFTLNGGFNIFVAPYTYLFEIQVSDWSNVVNFDTTYTNLINSKLNIRFGYNYPQIFGQLLGYQLGDVATYYDNVTVTEFYTDYTINSFNWPKQFRAMTQLLAWASVNPTNVNAQELVATITPIYLETKPYNLNVHDQNLLFEYD